MVTLFPAWALPTRVLVLFDFVVFFLVGPFVVARPFPSPARQGLTPLGSLLGRPSLLVLCPSGLNLVGVLLFFCDVA